MRLSLMTLPTEILESILDATLPETWSDALSNERVNITLVCSEYYESLTPMNTNNRPPNRGIRVPILPSSFQEIRSMRSLRVNRPGKRRL